MYVYVYVYMYTRIKKKGGTDIGRMMGTADRNILIYYGPLYKQ